MVAIKRYRLTQESLNALRLHHDVPHATLDELGGLLNVAHTRKSLTEQMRTRGIEEPSLIRSILERADRYTWARAGKSLRSHGERFVPNSRYVLPLTASFMLRPLPFALLFRARLAFFELVNRLRSRRDEQSPNSNLPGFHHNRKQMGEFLTGHRERTERFAILLRCMSNVDVATARMLCVGPRNEAEILLLRQYGFAKVTAIDLFTYSPLIDVMDMNNLAFGDAHFDIYYSSFVLSYSPDVGRTLSEALRVTKPGGIHVFGWTTTIEEDHYGLTPAGSDIKSFADFESRLGENLSHVYWKDSYQYMDQRVFTIIYRTRG